MVSLPLGASSGSLAIVEYVKLPFNATFREFYLSSVWLGSSNTSKTSASAFVVVESLSLFERYTLVEEAHNPLLHTCARTVLSLQLPPSLPPYLIRHTADSFQVF